MRPLVFCLVRNPTLAATLRDASDSLKVLIKGCDTFTIIETEEELPVGCVGENISADLAMHLLIKVAPLSAFLVLDLRFRIRILTRGQ